MPVKKYRDKFTGGVYEIPWNDATRNPSDDEIEILINQKKRQTTPTTPRQSLFSRVNKPLTTVFSRNAKKLSDVMTTPHESDSFVDDNGVKRSRPGAKTAGFAAGAVEGLGDLADSFTNPIDLVSTLLGAGGLVKGAKAGKRLIKAGSMLTGARGAYNIGEGSGLFTPKKEKKLSDLITDNYQPKTDETSFDPAKMGLGALELALSVKGFKGADKIDDLKKLVADYDSPIGPQMADHPKGTGPNKEVRRLGTGTTFKSFGDFVGDARNNPDIDKQLVNEAEKYGISQDNNGRILSRRTQYNGPGNRLPDIEVAPTKSEVVKPSSIDKIGAKTKAKVNATKDPHSLEANQFEGESITVNPLEKMDEKVLSILVKSGNKDAIKELARRKGETGSANVGGFFEGLKETFSPNLINKTGKNIEKLKPGYQTWVNNRAARKGQSFNVKKDFADLEPLGMDAVFAYNAGERGGRFADVQKWFDEMHTNVSNAGIKLGFKENYLPQIWDNSKDEVAKVFGNKRLTLKPGIAFKSIIDTYQEGMKKGLTPKFKSIPELMGYYSEVANKSIADRQFFKYLKDNKLIASKSSKRAKNWKALDQSIFPTIRTKDKNIIEWHAPPDVHQVLDNYLTERGETGKAILRGIQLTKDVAMASGLPGTAFNAHGFNMLRRSAMVKGVTGFTKALGHMVNPGSSDSKGGLGNKIAKFTQSVAPWDSADKVINNNRAMIPDILRHGGRLGVEGHEFDTKLADTVLGKWGSKGANKITEWHKDLFETHLFDKMIPALKIDYYKSSVDDLIKTGLPEADAKKQAARAMNLAFAGVNYDELATNKTVLDISRAFLLAPDWYASNVGLAKNVGQSFLNSNHPGAKLYRNAGKGLIGAYITANIANKIFSDKFMWDNDAGRAMDIDTGTYTMNDNGEKKKVYVSPFGTAFDAFKIPIGILSEVYKDISSGDGSPVSAAIRPLKNRTSLPAHSAINLLSNSDDFNRRIYGRDTYGKDIEPFDEVKNTARELSSPFTPAYVKGIFGGATGSMSPLEAASQSIEAPLSFTRQSMPRKGKKQKKRKK